MDVLITGDEGFIGSYFKKQLSTAGHWVEGCDIKSGYDCRKFFEEVDQVYDLVIHCAAIVGGRETIENDPISVATDLAIDADFFNWIERTKQRRAIYFSSSAAYPIDLQNGFFIRNLKESDITLKSSYLEFENRSEKTRAAPMANSLGIPDMTYGWTKLTGEYVAQYTSVPVHIFRPFSGYGPSQDLTYPFPAIIKRFKDKEDPFDIWGTGQQVRDFVYIEDVYQTVMAAYQNDFREPINICSGIGTSFNGLIKIIGKQIGWEPRHINYKLDKPVGVLYRVGDPEKSHSLYKPKYPLERGIERMIHA